MGGRVKRSDGYNVDEFVGDNSDVEYQSSESEYEGNDSDDSFDDVKAATKPKKKAVGKAASKKNPANKTASVRTPSPDPAVFSRTIRSSARKATTLLSSITEDGELDEIIGAETDDEVFDSDVSDFEAEVFRTITSEDSDTDTEKKNRKKSSKVDQAKQMPRTPSPSQQVAQLLTPPSTNGKRARDKDTDEDCDEDSTKHERAAKRIVTNATPQKRGPSLSSLSEQFGMRKTVNVEEKQTYLAVEEDMDGPYYV